MALVASIKECKWYGRGAYKGVMCRTQYLAKCLVSITPPNPHTSTIASPTCMRQCMPARLSHSHLFDAAGKAGAAPLLRDVPIHACAAQVPVMHREVRSSNTCFTAPCQGNMSKLSESRVKTMLKMSEPSATTTQGTHRSSTLDQLRAGGRRPLSPGLYDI